MRKRSRPLARYRVSGATDSLPAKPLDPVAALALIRSELQREAETPESGYLTAKQWAEEWGMSSKNALDVLRKGISLGIVTEKDYRVKVFTYLRPVRHFRVVDKPA